MLFPTGTMDSCVPSLLPPGTNCRHKSGTPTAAYNTSQIWLGGWWVMNGRYGIEMCRRDAYVSQVESSCGWRVERGFWELYGCALPLIISLKMLNLLERKQTAYELVAGNHHHFLIPILLSVSVLSLVAAGFPLEWHIFSGFYFPEFEPYEILGEIHGQ